MLLKSTPKNKEKVAREKIAQAAEAIIYKEGDKIIKYRIKKKYRIQKIDEELRRRRTKLESKILLRARRYGVNVPAVLEENKYEIIMEYIDGQQLKNVLNKKNYKSLMKKVAEQVSLLHGAGIVHGDLTTSNMILRNNDVFLIDFGLAQNSNKIEDRAVDLYLLKQALESKHHEISDACFETFMKYYKVEDKQQVVDRLKDIEKRRRYKS